MRIDVHAHYWTEDYIDLLMDLGKADAGAARGLGAGGGADLEARLRLMDRAGSKCRCCPPARNRRTARSGQGATAARFVNDQYTELVQRQPGPLSPPSPRCRCRTSRSPSAKWAGPGRAAHGRGGDEHHRPRAGAGRAGYEPVFAELNRRNAVLYLHPAGNSACTPLIADYHLTWMVGAPVEDTISIMQLITRGIPARYPDIKIINSHLGGALPMLLQRADDQYRWEAPDTPERPSVAARRMWYDTVGHGHVPALRCAIDSFGADRLLLGTDFPYENGDTFIRAVDYINDPQIDPNAARAILDQNAAPCSASGTNAREPPTPGEDEVISLVIAPVCASTDRDVPSAVRELKLASLFRRMSAWDPVRPSELKLKRRPQ